jgi:hypothetical protein
MLILFLLEHVPAARLRRSCRLAPFWSDRRPDLPAGSAQAEAASIRGPFGRSIAWMCRRHGIGPGHKDWPELSRAIVSFGGSLKGFDAGAPPRGLYWWEHPGVVPGMVPFVTAPNAPTAALLQRQAVANAPPPARDVTQSQATQVDAVRARLPASWVPASSRQVFARAGPNVPTGPPGCPGRFALSRLNARGRSTAGPAVLIRAALPRPESCPPRHCGVRNAEAIPRLTGVPRLVRRGLLRRSAPCNQGNSRHFQSGVESL